MSIFTKKKQTTKLKEEAAKQKQQVKNRHSSLS